MDSGVRINDEEAQYTIPEPSTGPQVSPEVSDQKKSVFADRKPPKKGRPSAIKDYCESQSSKNGDQQHLWICKRRDRRYFAYDIRFLEDETIGIRELRKGEGLFKRYFSLYSAIALQEGKVLLDLTNVE